MNLYLYWANLISLSVIGLYLVPFLVFLYTKNPYELLAWVGMVFTVGLNETLKYMVVGERSPRPAGARDCNLWVNNGPQGGRPGMPSGHAAHVSFFTGYYLQRLGVRSVLAPLLLIYACLVMFSRYTKRCHTMSQLVMGSVLGLFLSLLFYPLSSPSSSLFSSSSLSSLRP